ncbi:hypothetical protein ZWY2020_056530 [Hordeum vulgare]|nr:hypothetical protein ZWY2020_056530 [Hordeum vulgare]
MGRLPEYYAGTSLRRPPPPLDPERDPRLPLPGSPGDVRRREGPRMSPPDVDREAALHAELVARPPPAPRSRDVPAPCDPLARPPTPRSSAPTWRRDRQDHHREDRRGGPPMRHGEDDLRSDSRSSRAKGADWRRDDGTSRRASPVLPPAAPPAAPSLAKKKKKSKKKKMAGAPPAGDGCADPMGDPEIEAPDPPTRGSRQCCREDTMCINCGCAGHYRSECEAPPRCPSTLAYVGCGTERGSFYFVDAEIEEEVARLHPATVTLATEQATPAGLVISTDLIRAELAAYIGDFWDSEFAWEVTETASLIFSVPFPLAELLRAATTEPNSMPPLEKVWVLVYGLPRGGSAAPWGGKLTHILKAISEPVGKLITADLASFENDGPARIEILYPTLAEIDGLSLVFYFGSKGRRLTFELESPAPVDPLGLDPDDPEHGDGGLDDEGGSSEEGSSFKGDDTTGGAQPESPGVGQIPAASAAGTSERAGHKPGVALVPVSEVDTRFPPLLLTGRWPSPRRR